MKGPRKGVRLFTIDPSSRRIRMLPLQVNPIDDDGHLVFFDDQAYLEKESAISDLLLFRLEDFGAGFDATKDRLPCRGRHVYEIKDPHYNRYAYLTNCGIQGPPIPYPGMVAFDKERHSLESAIYRYRFNPDNYMQFDSIKFYNDQQMTWRQVANDSRLVIRADVRNFFNMNFDSDQIESRLEASRLGPIANLARVSFYLRILFFKISMSLATDVAFFSDSGHIPMMVNLPVNAYDYLNPASGILYTWTMSSVAKAPDEWIEMPRLNVSQIKEGWQQLAQAGLKNCRAGRCSYRFSAEAEQRRLSMDLDVAQDLVARGFFPQFVDDVAAYQEQMGWGIDIPKGEKRVGMYFEVSGLPKGGHPWNFWLRLGGPLGGAKTCPSPIHISRLKVQ